jgi:hypothetical protein
MKQHIPTRSIRTARVLAVIVGLGALCTTATAFAQGSIYQPLNHRMSPGVAGYWAAALGRATPLYLQPVKVVLPSKGTVTFYDVTTRKQHTAAAPAMARLGVGFTFRIRIDLDKTETTPATTLYPSIEVIDRLHPPLGKADQFPIPVRFTQDDIDLAVAGRMVTKVVYLEQPQRARPANDPLPTATIAPNENLLKEADRRGRPMLIVRLGGRQPDSGDPWSFIGRGGPLQMPGR